MKQLFKKTALKLCLAGMMSVGIASTQLGCGDSDDNNAKNTNNTTKNNTTEKSLYEQIGGQTAVKAVVGEFLTIVGKDDRINWMFANADLVMLGTLLEEQVCAATGGGCTYTGKDMKTAHTGMGVTDAQFDALIEDFLKALDNLNVPYSATLDGSETIDPLLKALVDMRVDIVEDADADKVYFNQLGGYAGVSAVIDGLLTNVAADARINTFFADTDLDMLRQLLIEQVCEATGGYCVYSGRDMKTSHEGLGISDADFDALVEDLLKALDTLNVPYSADFSEGKLADALIKVLASMRADIVEAQ